MNPYTHPLQHGEVSAAVGGTSDDILTGGVFLSLESLPPRCMTLNYRMDRLMVFDIPKSLFLDQVNDVRAPFTSYADGSNERELGPAACGIISTIGPFLVDRFAAALGCIVASKDHTFSNETIAVGRVLAQPWRPDRMASAIELREKGPAPRIAVTRVKLDGHDDFFIVVDGCHRTYAARRWGDTTIEAQVQGAWHCTPLSYGLVGTQLVRGGLSDGVHVAPSNPLGPKVEARASEVPYDLALILHALGCPGKAATTTFRFW